MEEWVRVCIGKERERESVCNRAIQMRERARERERAPYRFCESCRERGREGSSEAL